LDAGMVDKTTQARAAKTSCALDALAPQQRLGALAYYYEGEDGHPNRDIATSVIASNILLTSHHVPVAELVFQRGDLIHELAVGKAMDGIEFGVPTEQPCFPAVAGERRRSPQ
jgi:hypothetical protein